MTVWHHRRNTISAYLKQQKGYGRAEALLLPKHKDRFNMIEGGRTPFLPAAELQELGYAAVAYPCASVFTAVRALKKWAAHLRYHGTSAGFAGPDTMVFGAADAKDPAHPGLQPAVCAGGGAGNASGGQGTALGRPGGSSPRTPEEGGMWLQ